MRKPLQIKRCGRFNVVRGDFIEGGIKRLVLEAIIPKIHQKVIACSVHSLGYSQYALGLAGLNNDKTIILFYAEKKNSQVDVFLKTQKLKNVRSYFFPKIKSQKSLDDTVKKYCEENSAYHLPIGFESKEFSEELKNLALSLNINPPSIWLLSGSGTTARALSKAWPNTKFNIVNMGFTIPTIKAKVYQAREKPEVKALFPPPYQSASYYDAKLWYFVKKYGRKDALIWNIT